MLNLIFAAWCGHTDASRELAQDIDAALTAHGIKRAHAAKLMGLGNEKAGEKALIRQLAGVEPMNVWRLAALLAALPEVRRTLLDRLAASDGGTYLSPHQTLVIKGAAMLGHQRMEKMLPEWSEEERKRA